MTTAQHDRSDQRKLNNHPAAAGSMIDPDALMRVKNLEVRAKIVVEGFLSGLHRSPYHGISVEFSEYREYTPGDDPRHLDWRLFARSDRYYVKRFEDETNLRCYVLLDLSRSLNYGSADYTKAEYAKTLAATLAYFLTLQRDALGLVTFDQEVTEYLPARYRPGHMHRIMMGLERVPSGTGTNIHPPIDQIARTVKKRGLIVVISDLLFSLEDLETNLGYLTSQGHEVLMLRVLDPKEVDFSFDDASVFQDLESGREIYVDPSTVTKSYRQQFSEHATAVEQACLRAGVDFSVLRTDQPLELALFDFLRFRQHRGRKTFRSRQLTPAVSQPGAGT